MSLDKKQSVTSRIVFHYLMSHKLKIVLALLMMVISAAATGLHAWLVRPALDEVLIKGNTVSYTHLTLPTMYTV